MKGFHGLVVVLIVLNLILFPTVAAAEPAIPDNAAITSATLSVYINQVNGYTVNVHRITDEWIESGVTWSNFANSYDPAVIASFVPTGIGWQTIDVSDQVQDWISETSPNYGFLFTQAEEAPANSGYTAFWSSEYATEAQRPKLEICYDQPGSGNSCVTIQRSEVEPADVIDSYIWSTSPNTNYGTSTVVYTGNEPIRQKHVLLRFSFRLFHVPIPSVSIIKYTNEAEASDPNGVDVPRIAPGQPVTWVYEITNDGEVSVSRDSISVMDDQPGVNPVFASELSGNNDTSFDPGEVWLYQAVGQALDLTAPPVDVKTYTGCTNGGTEASRTAYMNLGTVTIPGASDTAQSSYCNPTELLFDGYKIWLPLLNNSDAPIEPDITPFKVTVGYEDLPLLGSNDYDYNDLVVRIQGGVILDVNNRDLWKRIRMNFEPGARGAAYTHSFHMNFPANTFSSDGTAELVTYGPDGSPLSTQTFSFVASSDNDFTIFANSGEIFPVSPTNTVEGRPIVLPQRTATLTIDFNQAIPFDLNRYNFTIAHGTGLFFDPYIRVRDTGEVVRRGDVRLLNVSEIDRDYLWPEERVRIDRAYPDLTFISSLPPQIIFPDRWWANNNTCIVDGKVCQ